MPSSRYGQLRIELLSSYALHRVSGYRGNVQSWPRWYDPADKVRLREVRPNLFVGGEHAPRLRPSGLPWRAVVDFAGTSTTPGRAAWYGAAVVLRWPFEDGVGFPPRALSTVAQTIAYELSRGPVLLHCHAGLSRSASAAYAMLRLVDRLDHEEALRRVKIVPEYPMKGTLRSARAWIAERTRAEAPTRRP